MPISPDHISELMRPFLREAQRKLRWLIVLSLLLGGLAWCIASLAYYRAHPLGPDAGTNALQRGVGSLRRSSARNSCTPNVGARCRIR